MIVHDLLHYKAVTFFFFNLHFYSHYTAVYKYSLLPKMSLTPGCMLLYKRIRTSFGRYLFIYLNKKKL